MAPKNMAKLFERQKKLGDTVIQMAEAMAQETFRLSSLKAHMESVRESKAEFIKNNVDLQTGAEGTEDYFEKKYYDYIMKIFDDIEDRAVKIQEESKLKVALIEEEDVQKKPPGGKTKALLNKEEEEVPLPNVQEELEEEFFDEVSVLEKDIMKFTMTLIALNSEQIALNEKRLKNKFEELKSLYDEIDRRGRHWRKIKAEINRIEIQMHEMLSTILGIKKPSNLEAPERRMPKLADIKIPVFDGEDIAEWSQFHDLFKSLVDSSTQLSDVEKLYYLKAALKGEAAKVIQQFKTTDSNYAPAFEVLKNRYENRRLLFETQVDRILDQPQINSDSATSVKQLLDTSNICIQAIKAMGIDITDAKPFIARIIIRKFDKNSFRFYEQNVKKNKEIQTLEDVMEFLEQQYGALSSTSKQWGFTNAGNKFQKKGYSDQRAAHAFMTTKQVCLHCNRANHGTAACRTVLELPIIERQKLAKNKRWCYKCINHTFDQQCRSNRRCSKCGKNHHEALHITEYVKKDEAKPSSSTSNEGRAGSFITRKDKGKALLPTALVKVRNQKGEFILMRALIDNCSESTSISEEAVQRLQLPKMSNKTTNVYGLGNNMVGKSKATVDIELRSRVLENEMFKVEALVLPSLSEALPESSFEYDVSKWEKYCLADPSFNKTGKIDIVIGEDLMDQILVENIGIVKVDRVVGQKTKLGWVLFGTLDKPPKSSKMFAAVTTTIERFWEIEEVPEIDKTSEKDECVEYFEETTAINDDHKLVVRLPFEDDRELGNSRKQAMARLLNLEKRFKSNPKLKHQYVTFMKEYNEMGHMEERPINSGRYYLPHQAVVRENSITTKLRVVFDASAKSTNKRSLNDILKVGPKLQKDIFDIIIKWRLWRYVLTADVEKMYRQIVIHKDDQQYQHILWREEVNKPIQEFALTTVTYGTASAPFLAKKALAYIGDDCANENIKQIILNDFYMDDLMTGADSAAECKEIQQKTTVQLAKFGLPLRKWMSNNRNILKAIPYEGNVEVMPIDDEESIKTLGLQWHPGKDIFAFILKADEEGRVSKRRALSTLARIFDPLGWLSPFTTCVKLFIQKLWLLQIDWDVLLDDELQTEWQTIIKSLPCLQKVAIPRWYNTTIETCIEIHGFADASQKAYAAVVYIKVGSTINMVAGKSKVNPVKNRKTLPKLELCAAHLLARLVNKIIATIQRQVRVNTWSDSTITLAWINNNKSKDRFIRSRVDEIKALLPNTSWRHVDTKSNPADTASRGVTADKIPALWWTGPDWLKMSEDSWPQQNHQTTNFISNIRKSEDWLDEVSKRCSSFQKLERVIAYVQRFVGKLKGKKYPDWLTSVELKDANGVIIRQHQEENFFEEIKRLKLQKEVEPKSKIATLHPFLDKNGILRVGGRLQNSELSYDHKHPVLIEKSWLAELIVNEVHASTLHGGNQLVASIIRRRYWMIGMKNTIKKVLRYCVRCIRYKKLNAGQIMGNLPQIRVSVSHPFTHTGVDYAGPIQMKCSRGRGQRSFKGYIAVFVCMTTKAIHLEPVSDLTSEAFLAALRRFFARRGRAKSMYSDNGTNFVGASRKLDKEFIEAIRNNSTICETLEAEKVEWHFIPPASPHFGGIWEAGVKSMKHHLKRVIGDSRLTFEEMTTLLAQIEAVLNSRPIYALNEVPEEVDVLTPAHFLIGRPLVGSPEVIDDRRIGCRDRWKLIQKMRRDFWLQWKEEYLVTLQHRYKWRSERENLKLNQIVIVKDEATDPAKWPLGKVIEAHEGKDGKVRVVTLKMMNGVLKRPIHKLCPLQDIKEETNDQVESSISCFTRTSKVCNNSQSTSPFRLMLLLLMLSNAVQSMSTVKLGGTVRSLGNGTILYMDKIGTLNRVSSSWSLVAYYDMAAYFITVGHIDQTLNNCKDVCEKLRTFEDQCGAVLRSMEDRLKDIQENDKLFSHQGSQRYKRAPFEFIGSFNHVLFGMMDAEDRTLIKENMRKVLENEQGVLTLTARIGRTTLTSPENLRYKQVNEFRTYLFKEVKDVEKITPLSDSRLNNSAEVNELLKVIKNIKSENIELKSLNWHHVSGHSSLMLISIFLIIILIFLIRKHCIKNTKIVDVKFNVPRQNVQIS